MTNIINRFTEKVDGEWVHSPLSNFFIEPDGTTVEAEFQALKALDPTVRAEIRAMGPGAAKRAGRAVDLRPDWEQIKVPAMASLVTRKFTRHESLRSYLAGTRTALLVEGNTWHDNFWGDCSCARCKVPGQNALGVILMTVRARWVYGA